MPNSGHHFFSTRLLWTIAAFSLLEACASLGWFGKKEPRPAPDSSTETSEKSATQVKEVARIDEDDDRPLTRGDLQGLELKHAKLWARIDELDNQLKKSKERLRVMERGLVLGLMPPELQLEQENHPKSHSFTQKGAHQKVAGAKAGSSGNALQKPPQGLALTDDEGDESAKPIPKKKAGLAGKEKAGTGEKVEPPTAEDGAPMDLLGQETDEEYQRRLAMAQDHFRAGRFGQAIAEYGAIGKEFGQKVPGGSHKYWIALSWYNLKEYQTAFNTFSEFLTEFPMSALVPRAKLDLGRVELKLGLKDKAMARFREIMRDFPYEDAAEMARMEMNQLQKNL